MDVIAKEIGYFVLLMVPVIALVAWNVRKAKKR